MTEEQETEFFRTAITTYGKTWHTWDMLRSEALPLGRPALMMSFTRTGELSDVLVRAREAKLGTDTAQLRARRERVFPAPPPIDPAADRGGPRPAPEVR